MRSAVTASVALCGLALAAHAKGDLKKVNHVVVVMQENHSFDNYFGVLPYVPGGSYRAGPCRSDDHACVDGLSCARTRTGLSCSNSNVEGDGRRVFSFHSRNYCPGPDLVHEWPGSHKEANYLFPALTWLASPNDGFVRVNDTLQLDKGGESRTEDDTMGYYDQADLPFYYGLAQTFAISDRYFSSVMGPTFPNRAYALAATSFGHLTTFEILPPLPPAVPPPGGYKPITGTIMDLLDRSGVSWANYFADVPTTAIFRGVDTRHWRSVAEILAAPASPVCTLPAVSFVDPAFGDNSLGTNPAGDQFDEHPPSNIRKGQFFVSAVVNSIRASACWRDTVVLISYDEHGGFYDHVRPPLAPQGFRRNPDGISPGQCADDSNPPASRQPSGGTQCSVSQLEAAAICPGFTPTGRYPAFCANFDQLGFRVPFVAVSPFSRPHYVSHQVADHTSVLALIEKRFLPSGPDGTRQHLTARDAHAGTLEDLFDFDAAPSSGAPVPTAPVPLPNDPGCPFVK